MIAMVTGASSGFGRAISRLLVSAGHRVIGTGRRAERLAALAEELGEQFLPLVFDVRDKATTMPPSPGCRPPGREVDLLVNNAGLALGLEPAHKAISGTGSR